MEEKKSTLLKSTMTYGAIVGISLVIYTAILYLIGQHNSKWLGSFSYVVIVAGLFFSIKTYRDKELNGSISYKDAVLTGILTSVFAAIIIGFFTYIMVRFIDPSMIDKALEEARQQILDKGVPESQVDMQMKMMEKIISPFVMFLSQTMAFSIGGAIFSLIIAAFLKKEPAFNPNSDQH